MPLYEYTCKSCSTNFERLVRSARDEGTATCPKCGSTQTARALSVFAVASEGARSSAAADVPMCGRCGGAPGSCQM